MLRLLGGKQGQLFTGFSPAMLPSLGLWLDATRITGLNTTDPVTTWSDLSTAANHVTQATAGNKPLYITGAYNGKPCVRFDGTDDFLASGDVLMGLTGLTVCAAVKTDGAAVVNQFIIGKAALSTSQNGWRCYLSTTDGAHVWRGGTTGNSTVWIVSVDIGSFDTNLHVVSATFGIGAQTLRRDGAQIGAAAGATAHEANTANLTVGANSGGAGGERLDGDLTELVVCTTVLGPSTLLALERYMGKKWGVLVA